MISLTNGTSTLELNLLTHRGDAQLSCSISSHGYSGKNESYILTEDFTQFCQHLLQLQKTLKGAAVLNSMSPEELYIKIAPLDSLGHLLINGNIGQHIHSGNKIHWHCIEFSFEVDPQQLDKAVKIDWIQQHANQA